MSQTAFIESEALLAVIRDDEDEAKRLLATMLPGELRELAAACCRLDTLASEEALSRCR